MRGCFGKRGGIDDIKFLHWLKKKTISSFTNTTPHGARDDKDYETTSWRFGTIQSLFLDKGNYVGT